MATLLPLKPCPWCGESPMMEPWHGGGPRKQHVHCVSDFCDVRPGVTGETPSEATFRWNQRAPITVQP